MNEGRTVFSQLMDFLPLHQFRHCVERYGGNYKIQASLVWISSSAWPLHSLPPGKVFATSKPVFVPAQPNLYHMGFRGAISRSNLGYANEHRDWRMYADFAQILIATARDLYRDEPFGVQILSVTIFEKTPILEEFSNFSDEFPTA